MFDAHFEKHEAEGAKNRSGQQKMYCCDPREGKIRQDAKSCDIEPSNYPNTSSHRKESVLFYMEYGGTIHDFTSGSSFLRDRSRSTIPVPVRICPMPAIPEIDAEAPVDSTVPNTCVTPRTAIMTAVRGTPIL